MADIPVNIKEYIINSRQAGQSDSKIITALKSANWPEDIINMALQQANAIIQPVPEPVEVPINTSQTFSNLQEAKNNEKDNAQKKLQESNNLLENNQQKNKKKFCFLTIIALLFSPIPFIGLGLAMTSFDLIKKKNMSGAIIAVLALLINIAVILFVVYIIVQLLTLNSFQLEGISRVIVERLGILG